MTVWLPGVAASVRVVVQAVPEPLRTYVVVPSVVARVKPEALPSAQVMPLFPPVYVYVIVAPAGSVIDLTRAVTAAPLPGVGSYVNEKVLSVWIDNAADERCAGRRKFIGSAASKISLNSVRSIVDGD